MASYDEAMTKMYTDRLTAFYTKYDAPKVAKVPELLAKYKGKEDALLAAMVKKYGPEPEPASDEDDSEAETEEDEDDETGRAQEKGARADSVEDLEEEAAPEEPESDGEDKVPIYCGVCGLPPEYCEFGPQDYAKCAAWIEANCPHLLKKGVEQDEKKRRKRGGGIIRKKEVAEDKQRVTMCKEVRSKKKAVTVVEGLETLGVKLKDAAKLFGKKFAASSSVKEKDTGGLEIVIQGDVIYDLPDLLVKAYKIPKSKMFEKEKGGKLTKVR
mmetsp:Transcript_23311/g.69806  ORF Transcript_23311/g.69806 Transcript_23311/m.69806 type:complete len:270 (+) Transcript_23311:159-968(+)